MAYKDKDRQREAVRQAVQRHRAKTKGITAYDADVIPRATKDVIPKQSHNPMMVGYVPPRTA